MHETSQLTPSSIKHNGSHTSASKSRLIRLSEVMSRVSLSRTTIYNRMNDGTFPKSVKLGSRAVAWQESSIDEWIAALVDSAQAEEVRS